jgi:hypothetical protein
MNISIPTGKLMEIARQLDAGRVCYYHIQTRELECIPKYILLRKVKKPVDFTIY